MADLAVRVVWVSRDQAWDSFMRVVAPWCRDRFKEGARVVVELRLYEDAKTDRQRRYFHGVILKEISEQAAPAGVKHSLQVWKEYFRAEFLGFKTVSFVNPLTGRKSRRRQRLSTEDLGVKAYAKHIERVTAFGILELGVLFSCPTFKQYEAMNVDPETGEILP